MNDTNELSSAIADIDRKLEPIETEMRAIGRIAEPQESHLQKFERLQVKWDALDLERRTLATKLQETRAAKVEAVRAMASKPGRVIPITESRSTTVRNDHTDPWAIEGVIRFDSPAEARSELRGRALSAVEKSEGASDDARELASKLIEKDPTDTAARYVLATSDPAYVRAFAKMLADPTMGHMGFDDRERHAFARAQEEQRAMSLTDSAGGFAVPFTLDPTFNLTSSGTVDPMRQIAGRKTTSTDSWNGINTAGLTASWDSEGTEVSDDAPTLSQPAVTVHKAQAFVPASFEVHDDIPNLQQELQVLFADAKVTLEAAAFWNGSGTNEPFGLITDVAAVTTSRVSATTNDAFGVVDIYKTIEALPARHRGRARWAANLTIINKIRQFATSNNYHAFLSDLEGDSPAKMLGKPLHEANEMDGTIGTGDDDVLIVGDFSKYLICDRIGATLEFIPNLMGANGRPKGQRGYLLWWRCGGSTRDTGAFRLLRV